MNRNLLIGLVIGILVLGGVAVWWLAGDDNGDGSTNQNQTNQSETAEFNPLATTETDYRAIVMDTETEVEATFEYDADTGYSRYDATIDSQEVETITTDDAYYTRVGEGWIRYPVSTPDQSTVDVDSYTYDESDISQYRDTAVYEGVQTCSSGTCDVWSNTIEGVAGKVYIDTETRQITRLETTVDGKTVSIDYEYTDVVISPPQNFQELPNITQ